MRRLVLVLVLVALRSCEAAAPDPVDGLVDAWEWAEERGGQE